MDLCVMQLAHAVAEAVADSRADRVLRPGASASLLSSTYPEPSASEKAAALEKREEQLNG